MPTDGLVAPCLVCLSVGADEPACGPPALLPALEAEARFVEMVAGLRKSPPTPADRHPGIGQACLELREPGLPGLEPALLVEALGAAGIAPDPSPATPNPNPESLLDGSDSCLQACGPGAQVAPAGLPGVLRGTGDGAGPTRRRLLCGSAVALGTGGALLACVEPSLPAPLRQVPAHQRAEVRPEGHEHRLVFRRGPEAGADAGTGEAIHHERLSDGSELARH